MAGAWAAGGVKNCNWPMGASGMSLGGAILPARAQKKNDHGGGEHIFNPSRDAWEHRVGGGVFCPGPVGLRNAAGGGGR